jgi:hypothetical protein
VACWQRAAAVGPASLLAGSNVVSLTEIKLGTKELKNEKMGLHSFVSHSFVTHHL